MMSTSSLAGEAWYCSIKWTNRRGQYQRAGYNVATVLMVLVGVVKGCCQMLFLAPTFFPLAAHWEVWMEEEHSPRARDH